MSHVEDNDFGSALLRRLRSATPDEDSEIDFDDEADDDQLVLDVLEAEELGVQLDDPESAEEEEGLP